MAQRLKSETYTINKVYKDLYKHDMFFVNRKYQRKLVWTLEEKQALIDTIFQEYPVPMFLVACDYQNEKMKWEIIDGLQRLDAIISFINGAFMIKINGKTGYFDLDAFTGYGKKIEDGIIEQQYPTLPLEICEQFLDYELSFSIIEKPNCNVEEVFRRINSTGRKLSKQDLRQAGVTGNFSDLVRKTATYIRGDYTAEDIVKFSKIADYSLTNKKLSYGIDINNIFWIEKDIISESSIRRSKDEEIIAHIYMYLITRGDNSSSTSSLEKAYDIDNPLKQVLDNYLKTEDDIIRWMDIFSRTLSIIGDVLLDDTFSWKLFGRENVYNKDYSFLIVFCAITVLSLNGMIVSDRNGLAEKFNNLGNDELLEITNKSKIVWNKEVRDRLIERVKNVIKPYFSYASISNDDYDHWNIKMINFLEKAYTEEQMYDFKIGITNFKTGTFNKGCISKIVETLAAMVNTKCNENGYVLLGVPDNDDDANFISSKLHTDVKCCGNYKILGIQDEANTYYKDVDDYLKRIKETIENEPVSDTFKHEILTKCHPIEYKGKLLYLFVCKSSAPVYYNKKLYVRYGSHNHEVELGSSEFDVVMKRFYSNSESDMVCECEERSVGSIRSF